MAMGKSAITIGDGNFRVPHQEAEKYQRDARFYGYLKESEACSPEDCQLAYVHEQLENDARKFDPARRRDARQCRRQEHQASCAG